MKTHFQQGSLNSEGIGGMKVGHILGSQDCHGLVLGQQILDRLSLRDDNLGSLRTGDYTATAKNASFANDFHLSLANLCGFNGTEANTGITLLATSFEGFDDLHLRTSRFAPLIFTTPSPLEKRGFRKANHPSYPNHRTLSKCINFPKTFGVFL
jgi:hypothetical protein